LTVELVMLVWSLLLIPFTYSRAGLLVTVVVVFLGILFFRDLKARSAIRPGGTLHIPIRRVAEGVILVVALAGLTYLAGSRNEFFARVWEYWRRKPDQGYARYFIDYFEYLGFGARFTYWQTAYNIFEANPVLGVGLGNYVFYFEEELPDQALALQPEVLRLVVPEEGSNRLITAKHIILRLLAETGLLGTAAFLAFVMAVLGCALYMWFTPGQVSRFWGIGGLLGMIAFGLVAFSFDSFAIPNMWVVFGLITSAAHLEQSSTAPISGRS
jgi:O-antigen ligase